MNAHRVNTSVLGTQLAGVARRPGRLVLSGLSVLIAAFVVFGTLIARDITTRTAMDMFSSTARGATVVATPGSGNGNEAFTAQQLGAVRAMAEVADVNGRAAVSLRVGGSDTTVTIVSDPGVGALSRVRLAEGTYPRLPGEVALDRRTAQRLAVSPGAELTLRDPNGSPVRVTVTAVVDGPPTRAQLGYAGDDVVGELGDSRFDRIDVRAATGIAPALLTSRIGAVLGKAGPVRVTTASTVRTTEARARVRELDQIFLLISMFVGVTVVAAALVATSTFRILFAQRLRHLALLRTIGAQRTQLAASLAVEGAATGLVAGSVGVLLALGAGAAAPAVASAVGRDISTPAMPWGGAPAVVLGAVVLTLCAVIAPALSAARVPPMQALRSASTNAAERGIGRVRLGAGLVAGALSVACVGQVAAGLSQRGSGGYNAGAQLVVVVLSATLMFLALIALGPLLVRPLLTLAGWPLRRIGPIGNLAVSGIGGAPRRAAAVSVVVALGVALVTGTVVMGACLQGYVDREVAVRVPAHFLVQLPDPGTTGVVDRLAASPELADVTAFRSVVTDAGNASDLDLAALPALDKLGVDTGRLRPLRSGEAVLGHTRATELEASAGDSIAIVGPAGTVKFAVVATLTADQGPTNSDLFTTPADLDKLGADGASLQVLANAATDAAGRHGARAALRSAVAEETGAVVVELADTADEAQGQLAVLVGAVVALLGLTVLVAVIGVGTTTALSVTERTHESGLLRALGLGRPGLRRMIALESGLYGVIGAVMGLLLGVPYAWLSILALDLRAPLTLPAGQLLLIFVTLASLTAVAGMLPARRAARTSPVVALGAEQ